MKKAILTGSTKGLGRWIKEYLESKNYEISEFNRSQGNDISQLETREKIRIDAQTSDLFINNAHDGFAQCLLLSSIYKDWQHQAKLIINIGASSFKPAIWDLVEESYVAEKAALHALVARLQQQIRSCKLTLLLPGMLDTGNTKSLNGKKISKESLLTALDFIILQSTTTEIRSLTIDSVQNERS